MIVNYETIKAAFEGFQAMFKEGWDQTVPQFEKFCMVVQSNGAQETYDWLGNFPAMREWISDRSFSQLKGYKQTIINKSWEATIEVDRDQFEDDRLGLLNPRLQQLGAEGRRHGDQIAFELLLNGFTALGPDGQYFFDTDHGESGSDQSNHGSTTAFSKAAIEAGIAAMMNFKDDRGKPLGIMPDTLIVPPALFLKAIELVTPSTLVVGTTAAAYPNYNAISELQIRVITSPYLSVATHYFLLATRYPMRPLIFQWRRMPEFNAIIDPKASSVFNNKKFLFGVDGRYNAGYGIWQTAWGAVGS